MPLDRTMVASHADAIVWCEYCREVEDVPETEGLDLVTVKRFICTHARHGRVLLGFREPDGRYSFEQEVTLPS